MSLARTALRFVTIEALRPTSEIAADVPAWPTLAQSRTFDSRIDPIDDLSVNERRPVIAVYTEGDDGNGSAPVGGPPFRRYVDLVLELAVVARADNGVSPQVYEAGIPETDAEIESDLDLLETQVRFVLLYGPTGHLWRKLTGSKVTKIQSAAHRTGEEAVKLALRTLSLTVEIPDDCFDFAPVSVPTGLARLPEPLRSVVEGLAESSYGRAIGLGLAAAAPVMPVRTPLGTVSIVSAATDPPQADGATATEAPVTIPQE